MERISPKHLPMSQREMKRSNMPVACLNWHKAVRCVSVVKLSCQDRREPLGVVASIVPFNFPLMVPMWTTPIALVMGNCVVLKPSEKVPLTMRRVVQLMKEAGIPDGVFNMVQGTKEAVESIIDHPDVK